MYLLLASQNVKKILLLIFGLNISRTPHVIMSALYVQEALNELKRAHIWSIRWMLTHLYIRMCWTCIAACLYLYFIYVYIYPNYRYKTHKRCYQENANSRNRISNACNYSLAVHESITNITTTFSKFGIQIIDDSCLIEEMSIPMS